MIPGESLSLARPQDRPCANPGKDAGRERHAHTNMLKAKGNTKQWGNTPERVRETGVQSFKAGEGTTSRVTKEKGPGYLAPWRSLAKSIKSLDFRAKAKQDKAW